MLIAIEGIDGSGKATLTKALSDELERRGRTVARETFPRYTRTSLSHAITDALGRVEPLDPHAAAAMFAAERLESRAYLRELLTRDVVLLDRYVHSNAAYQSARVAPSEQQSMVEWILNLEFTTFALPTPDLVVFIDTDVHAARARRETRTAANQAGDRPEQDTYEADSSMLARAHDAFRAMAAADTTCPWLVVDGQRPPSELAQSIADRIN